MIFLSPFVYYAQFKNSINVETGTLIKAPLLSKETLSAQSDGPIVYNYTYHSTTGFYLKLNTEFTVYKKNKLKIVLPIGFSLLNQLEKYERTGYTWTCSEFIYYNDKVNKSVYYLNLHLGLGFNYSLKHVDYQFYFNWHRVLKNSVAFESDYYNYRNPKFLSFQNACMFKVNKNMKLGPSLEIYFFKSRGFGDGLNFLISKNKFWQYNWTTAYQLQGKNVWINPGIKMQIGF